MTYRKERTGLAALLGEVLFEIRHHLHFNGDDVDAGLPLPGLGEDFTDSVTIGFEFRQRGRTVSGGVVLAEWLRIVSLPGGKLVEQFVDARAPHLERVGPRGDVSFPVGGLCACMCMRLG